MPRDGCRECSKRRIKCDKGTPECGKCLKKGIKCTGIGIQYKFAGGIAVRGKFKGLSRPVIEEGVSDHDQRDGEAEAAASQPSTYQDEDEIEEVVRPPFKSNPGDLVLDGDLLANWTENTDLVPHNWEDPTTYDTDLAVDGSTTSLVSFMADPRTDLVLENLKPGILMLFNHFSGSIAWIMVAFDHGFNGYRDIVLPLAYQDDLVQRAVSVTAAFHLAQQQPDLLQYAESGRAAIIAKLRSDAMSQDENRVFSLSTWVTIILLLVGETITGSSEFVQLFAMMASLSRQEKLLMNVPRKELHFILQQTRMQSRFQLFTPPLLDMSQGLETLQGDLSLYFDPLFLAYLDPTPLGVSHSVLLIQEAIHQARNIYIKQALHDLCPAEIYQDIEQLRLTVLPITSDKPGMHTLVWVYFVAAASSHDQGHREFFADRLVAVYAKTRMGNILVALKRLERIWEVQSTTGWVKNPTLVDPVLII